MMKLHRVVFLILTLLLPNIAVANPEADFGGLINDLSNWDFGKDGSYEVKHGWLFVPEQFIEERKDDIAKEVISGKGFPHISYGTFYTRIKVGDVSGRLGIKTPHFNGNIKIIIKDPTNGQVLARFSKGKTTSSSDTVLFDWRSYTFGFEHRTEFIIFMQKYSRDTIGTSSAPILGLETKLRNETKEHLAVGAIIFGFFILTCVFNIIIYLQTQNKESLWIGLFAAAQSVRFSITEGLFSLLPFFQEFGFTRMRILMLIASISFIFLPVFSFYIYRSIEKYQIGKEARYIMLGVLSFLVFQHTQSSIYYLNLVNLIYLTSYFICNLIICFLVIKKHGIRNQGSVFSLISFFLPAYAIIHDFLVSIGVTAVYINHWSILAFIVIQTILAGRRYATAFEENDRLLSEIQEQEKARTAFFHNTSHELRTPLNGIIGFVELLQKGRYGECTDQMRNQFSKIHRLAVSLKNQVNLILDLAKSKRGELTLNNSRIDLDDFVDEIESLASGLQLKYRNSSFTMSTSWERGHKEIFVHDRGQLLSILRNLIGNAFKFCRPNQENTVSVLLSKNPVSGLTITVEDQGIGIPADQMDKIFTEFKQVESDARRSYEGTGLGLAMVKQIVDLSGGKISLDSKVKEGARFTLTLPEQQAESIRETPAGGEIIREVELESVKEKPTRGQKSEAELISEVHETILVVDDNEINCEVARDILEGAGYHVEIANGGRSALDYLEHHHPHLVVLDLMMPEVSGEDVLQHIKNHSLLADIPVVLLTARATEEDRIYGLSLGADDYLAKPIIAKEMILRVRNLLGRIGLTRLVEHTEGREKMALMGDLLNELSYEIRDVNSSIVGDRKQSLRNIELLWGSMGLPSCSELSEITRSTFHDDLQKRMNQLEIPDEQKNNSKPLNIIKIILASSALSEDDLDYLWAEITALDGRQLLLTEALMSLAANVVRMTIGSERTYQIIAIILKYGQEPHPGSKCLIHSAVEEVLDLLDVRLKRARIQVMVDIPKSWKVELSHIELGQIAINLLQNAIDALDKASIDERHITISCQLSDDGAIHLLVANNGARVSSQERQRIFERAPAGDGIKGQGLFISKRIAQRAEGDLEILEDHNETCFQLTLKQAS